MGIVVIAIAVLVLCAMGLYQNTRRENKPLLWSIIGVVMAAAFLLASIFILAHE